MENFIIDDKENHAELVAIVGIVFNDALSKENITKEQKDKIITLASNFAAEMYILKTRELATYMKDEYKWKPHDINRLLDNFFKYQKLYTNMIKDATKRLVKRLVNISQAIKEATESVGIDLDSKSVEETLKNLEDMKVH